MVTAACILIGGPMGGAGVVGASLVASSLGLAGLGADGEKWDCWRAILHDFESPDARGRPVQDVLNDARVVKVRSEHKEGDWPQYWLKNKWNEEFRLNYVQFSSGEIAAHAVRI